MEMVGTVRRSPRRLLFEQARKSQQFRLNLSEAAGHLADQVSQFGRVQIESVDIPRDVAEGSVRIQLRTR